MNDEHCGTCRFYQDVNAGGLCRRRAPICSEPAGFARWPWVANYNWCGEYEEKPKQ